MKTFSTVNLFFVCMLFLGGCDLLIEELVYPLDDSDESSESSRFSCWEYELMLDVESQLATECSADNQCGQVMTGTGCGCMTDNLVANHNFYLGHFYDLLDEAITAGCSPDFDTPCDCAPAATPVCRNNRCVWQ